MEKNNSTLQEQMNCRRWRPTLNYKEKSNWKLIQRCKKMKKMPMFEKQQTKSSCNTRIWNTQIHGIPESDKEEPEAIDKLSPAKQH